jgi:serine/threonine protein kinase
LAAFVNVCNAVAHAHSRKVIHRDLKPENVVIYSYGQVILIDWGLAKVLDDAAVERLDAALLSGDGHTMEGQVLGTPLYMAPEQAAGRIDEIDERTDIYGLGAILFATITGAAPHESTQAKSVDSGAGVRGMLSSIASGATPHASEVHAQVDPALAAICGKAMARKRYARYQNASDLAEDVQRWMAGEPVSAFEEPTLQRMRRWVGRHQRVSQLLAALLAIVLATGATLTLSARHEYLAARQSRFEQISADVNEIELLLRSAASNLVRNTRFMATLPPIDTIVRARQGGPDNEQDGIQHLITIYTGLLRANPDYLAVSLVTVVNPMDESARSASQEIVRVERSSNDRSFVRNVPVSRLVRADENAVLSDVTRLEPGDVRLTVADPRQQTPSDVSTQRITGCVPVYDEASGTPFGMVAIETDLIAQLQTVLQSLGTIVGDIYIADGEGSVLASASSDGDNGKQTIGSLAETFPQLAPLFAPDFGELTHTDGATYIGRRFRVDATSKGVAIVARLAE